MFNRAPQDETPARKQPVAIYLEVPDVDAPHDALKKKGIVLAVERLHLPSVDRQVRQERRHRGPVSPAAFHEGHFKPGALVLLVILRPRQLDDQIEGVFGLRVTTRTAQTIGVMAHYHGLASPTKRREPVLCCLPGDRIGKAP
jgi:hypothetical protein